MAIAAPDPRLLHTFIFLLLLSAINSDIAAAAGAPAPSSSPASPAPLDPKQVRALESLNIPIFKDPCSPPPRSAAPPTITCDSAKPYRHVLSLTLVNCSGHLPLSRSVLESLSTLTSLNFINCHISLVSLPPQLASNLHSFTCINSLKKLTGVWLNRLQNLTDLTVLRSSITASGPAIVIRGKQSLHTVTLSQTNLSGALPRHWHPDLTFVDMSRNHLEGRIPFSLTRLGKLAHLNLSSNSLNGTLPSTIGYLTALQNFSLASNSLSGPIPKSLGSLTALRHLDLSNNQLNGAVPDFIGDMKKLKYLNLENNNFRGVLPFNPTFVKRLAVFKVGENSNLCYNHSTFTSKVKLGIAPCDKHGKPMSPPPAKDDSSDGSLGSDTGTVEKKKHHSGPSKVVLGFAIVISSIVFLIIFLVILIKCCR